MYVDNLNGLWIECVYNFIIKNKILDYLVFYVFSLDVVWNFEMKFIFLYFYGDNMEICWVEDISG